MTNAELDGWVKAIDQLGNIQRRGGSSRERGEPKRIVSKRRRRPQ
jgi:hypothetical protein